VASVNDDRFDVFVLADRLRFEWSRWRPLAAPSSLLAEIKDLTGPAARNSAAVEYQLRMILEA
jgi:hypothetical protein